MWFKFRLKFYYRDGQNQIDNFLTEFSGNPIHRLDLDRHIVKIKGDLRASKNENRIFFEPPPSPTTPTTRFSDFQPEFVLKPGEIITKCKIKDKYALSAIDRAKSDFCKDEIERVYCMNEARIRNRLLTNQRLEVKPVKIIVV